MKYFRAAFNSWQTTLAATFAALAAIGSFGHEWLDTGQIPDANAMINAIAFAATAWGLFSARDAIKSSQDAGIR